MHQENHQVLHYATLSLVFFTLLSGFVLSQHTFVSATDPSATATATVHVAEACTLSANNTSSHNAEMSNGTYEEGIGSTTFTVKCNDASGFALYAIGYSNEEYGNTNMIGDSTALTIPTGTEAVLGNTSSHWAMKVTKDTTSYTPANLTINNSFDSYHVVPDTYTKVATYTTSTDGVNGAGSSVIATYDARVSATQAADSYVGKVKFTLVHPSTAATPTFIPPSASCNTKVPGATYMQDITSSNKATILAGMTAGNRYYLRDSRDEKPYCVGKLADGNLWMLDNLALDIVTTDLNTLKGNTNASDTTLEYLKGTHVRGDGNITGDTNYPTAGVGYFDTNDYYSIPQIAISGDCNDAYCVNDPASRKWTSNSTTQAKINGTTSIVQGKIGIYYNYCAASAGSYCYGSGTRTIGSPTSDPNTSSLRDVTEDICPSGWRLPTSDNESAPYGEFKTLYDLYSGGTPSQVAAFETALSTPLSGYFSSGKACYQGHYGRFWSSTWNIHDGMKSLSVRSSSVGPSNGSNRNNSLSVRCILGS